MKLSVVMPVYNEKDTVLKVMESVLKEDLVYELIVVDDGSTDGTGQLLKDTKLDPKVKPIFCDKNKGKGAALRAGFKEVTGEVIIVQDADMEYDPAEYKNLIIPIQHGEADVVYGSRFLGVARPEGMEFANWLANKILTWTAIILYGKRITDEATCYKAFRKDVIDSVELTCQRFEFCPEVTSKVLKQKYRLVEVPIHYRGRTTLEGKKITWWDGFVAIWTLFKYRFRK